MKIFKKLSGFFRKPDNGKVDLSNFSEDATKKAMYYLELLAKFKDKNVARDEKDFQKAIDEIPSGKIVAFFNMKFLNAASERTFIELDEYVHQEEKEKAFYRGVFHGPCVIYAFEKEKAPDEFAEDFFGCTTIFLYL